MLSEGVLRRLETQLEALPTLLAGATPDQVNARPAPQTWSARENLAHLARYHAVFLERLRRMLEEDTPRFGRYRAEEDPEWPGWISLPLEEILARLKAQRARVVETARTLTPEQTRWPGVHPLFGAMPVTRWVEFFLLHEAHHLYVTLIRLGPVTG